MASRWRPSGTSAGAAAGSSAAGRGLEAAVIDGDGAAAVVAPGRSPAGGRGDAAGGLARPRRRTRPAQIQVPSTGWSPRRGRGRGGGGSRRGGRGGRPAAVVAAARRRRSGGVAERPAEPGGARQDGPPGRGGTGGGSARQRGPGGPGATAAPAAPRARRRHDVPVHRRHPPRGGRCPARPGRQTRLDEGLSTPARPVGGDEDDSRGFLGRPGGGRRRRADRLLTRPARPAPGAAQGRRAMTGCCGPSPGWSAGSPARRAG